LDENMQKLTDISAVRELLDRHGFRFSKSLGQNFLINPSVCPRMAEACGADKTTGVLEIGPGIGVLTRELALRAARVAAVEIDNRLLPVLGETLADLANTHVIHGDAMEIDLHKLIKDEFGNLKVAVCANLPYYITSPLLMRLLESRLPVDSITVMVQKEAARRLCARPGTRECGAVTLAVWYYSVPQMLFSVSRGSFMPAPNVDSAVIRLNIRSAPPCEVKNEQTMFRIIKAAFGQRRKTLHNALTGVGISKEEAALLLDAAGIPRQARAEELSLEQFAMLANTMK
jgi:16S rRNA (adenine1518-N6/adenine1519-N6)-dimethyltransferase